MIEVVVRRAFIAAAVKAYPTRVRLYARNVGVFKLEGGRFFHSAVKGQADIWGYFRGADDITRPIEIELKSARGMMKPEQEMWKEHCEAWGITFLMLVELKGEQDPVTRFVKELGDAISKKE